MIIRGNTVGTTVPKPDYAQRDESKSDFIRNKPDAAIQKAQKTADDVAANALYQSGGTMTGPISMGGQKLTDLPDPETGGEAVSRGFLESYVNARHLTAQIQLPASGWSSAAPYTQSVAVAGILASDCPHFGVVYSENHELEKEAFSLVDQLETGAGNLTFTCFTEKPGFDLTVELEVNR